MNSFVFGFQEVHKAKIEIAGGKGANLGELTKIDGIHVPNGFCISTGAFKRLVKETPAINDLLDLLCQLKADDRNRIVELSGEIRRLIEGAVIPQDIRDEITNQLSILGDKNAYAVRSSATAEDLPSASFAGQQDTYLNIIGANEILKHISKCWASLFTERAVTYRIQGGFDHRHVHLAVVVQNMIFPQTAGIMFTADPVTSNRKILSIDASFGLGETLVSGLVNADVYKVRKGAISEKKISSKKLAIYASKEGGTKRQEIEQEQQNKQALTDAQILQLEQIGRKIEEHFGHPQDIEWCLMDNKIYIVQSRPITTLYPIPKINDPENHIYVSVGHQQMMTDAMKPLGLTLWQLTAGRSMFEAGGRLFVDIAPDLASPARRRVITDVLGKSDPLFKDALTTLLGREDFTKSWSDEEQDSAKNQGPSFTDYQTLKDYDSSTVIDLIKRSQLELEELKQNIQTKSGTSLIDFILEDMQQFRKSLSNPQSFGVIMTGMNASSWINEKMQEWLGEKNAADTISQSVLNNVTSEMGLELLDVADAIRPYAEVIGYLQQYTNKNRISVDTSGGNFLDDLVQLDGGLEVREALRAFLNKYGMRCAGEIDITKTRWAEKPNTLIPIILNNIKSFEAGESKRKFKQGQEEAFRKEEELLDRLKQLPEGEQKAEEAKRMISLVRNVIGYREYPKYSIVCRYFVYKQALLKEAERLEQSQVIQKKEDVYYLTFEELREVVRTNTLDHQIVDKRKGDYKVYEKLTPPRIMTSDGEIITGKYKRENLPAEAIVGLAVSSGVIEGRARVILEMENADLEQGDILVTSFTDPSWTPLFVAIKGLVTEVGGLMTHGAVIAREYGLPAVVGVENATKLIKDGQRIRVHGTEGYVEIL